MNTPNQYTMRCDSEQIGRAADEELLLRLRLAKIYELERSLTEHDAKLAALRTMLSLGKPPYNE